MKHGHLNVKSNKVLNGKFHKYNTSGKTKNKMDGAEGHSTDTRNTGMEETGFWYRRMEASSEGAGRRKDILSEQKN